MEKWRQLADNVQRGRRQDACCANKEKHSCGLTTGDRDNGQQCNLEYTQKRQQASAGTARLQCNAMWTRANI